MRSYSRPIDGFYAFGDRRIKPAILVLTIVLGLSFNGGLNHARADDDSLGGLVQQLIKGQAKSASAPATAKIALPKTAAINAAPAVRSGVSSGVSVKNNSPATAVAGEKPAASPAGKIDNTAATQAIEDKPSHPNHPTPPAKLSPALEPAQPHGGNFDPAIEATPNR